jgi:hypothetical protein
MGYGALYIVQNFGMLLFSLAAPFIGRIVICAVVFLVRGKKKIWKFDLVRIGESTESWLKYRFWISFLDETYLFMFVCASLNLKE